MKEVGKPVVIAPRFRLENLNVLDHLGDIRRGWDDTINMHPM